VAAPAKRFGSDHGRHAAVVRHGLIQWKKDLDVAHSCSPSNAPSLRLWPIGRRLACCEKRKTIDKCAVALPVDGFLTNNGQAFFAGIMSEQVTGHEIAPTRIVVQVAAGVACVIRMVRESVASRHQYSRKLPYVRSHDIAIKMNHRVKAVNEGY